MTNQRVEQLKNNIMPLLDYLEELEELSDQVGFEINNHNEAKKQLSLLIQKYEKTWQEVNTLFPNFSVVNSMTESRILSLQNDISLLKKQLNKRIEKLK